MELTYDELDMAQNFYGYGCWMAPYWFIGPEQAMGRDKEKKPDEQEKARRVKTWRDLSCLDLDNYGLVDCLRFHCDIKAPQWHRERPKPALQPTWGKLLLTLLAFREEQTGLEDRRRYQRDKWGRIDGKTCVIELSGLPFPSLKDDGPRYNYREEGIRFIQSKMHKAMFVIMYGVIAVQNSLIALTA